MRSANLLTTVLLLSSASLALAQDTPTYVRKITPANPNTTRVDVVDPYGANANASNDKLAGAWRYEGQNKRYGNRYAGMISFFKIAPQRYRYERSLDTTNATPIRGGNDPRRETGTVEVTGTFVYTKQNVPNNDPGLLKNFGHARQAFRLPQRHGFFRLIKKDKARGFTYTPRLLRVTREHFYRRSGDSNNQVDLLIDGHEFFPLLKQELESAKRSICLQTFIYTEDSTGRWVGNLLAKKASEGVQVRVLLDGIDSKISKQLRKKWKNAGVELIIQHTWGKGIGNSVKGFFKGIWNGIKRVFGKKPKPQEKRGLFNHDHRKITVVDGRVGFIGGMNIAREYEKTWHDIHARVRGGVVPQLENLFYDRWKAAGGKVKSRPQPDPAVLSPSYWPGNMKVDVAVTLPGLKTEIKTRYLDEIYKARRSIHIEVAYFLDKTIINGLKHQAGRGIDTVVIIPNDEDHDVKIVRDAFNWAQNDVVRSGVKLYKYRGRMVHSKVASFDGQVATVGSANLDNMALVKLSEANIFVDDFGFAQEMEQRVFQTDIPQSTRVKEQKLGFWKKVKGAVLNLFKGIL